MIVNFRHKGLKKLYEQGDKSRIRGDMVDKATMYLSILDTAETLEELDITGFGFHKLVGNLKEFYSVKMSRNYRMIFRFEDGEALDVDLVDYH